MRANIVTYNVGASVGVRGFMLDLRRLRKKADVICLQEMGNEKKARKLYAKGWGYYRPRSAGKAVPILWRNSEFELIDKGTFKLSDRTFVGKPGAGPATLKEKELTWVKLLHKPSGRVVNVCNCHLAPTVQGKNGEPTNNPEHLDRLELYAEQMQNIRKAIKTFGKRGITILCGDLNVDFRGDRRTRARIFPFYSMTRVNMEANWSELGTPRFGTHGARRLIDYVYLFNSPRRAKFVSQKVLKTFLSDHRPVLVTINFTIHPRRRS